MPERRLCSAVREEITTGRDDWIRTSDPHTPSVMRYQAALRPDPVEAAPIGMPEKPGKHLRARASVRGETPPIATPNLCC